MHSTASILGQLPAHDVLNLHWISGFLDSSTFFRNLPRGVPLVWTLHDMNSFTGGCHFDAECGKYSERCGACPQLNSLRQNDFSAKSWSRKSQALDELSDNSIRLVTPSSWLAGEVQKSSLLKRFSVSVIPYGLDTDIFKPYDRESSRRRFGLPADAKIVLFVADYLSEKRKGLTSVIAAARELMKTIPAIFFVAAGHQLKGFTLGERFMAVDYVRDERSMAELYGAADLFVISSLQDNLPNTALEAQACGVPTVASSVGGLTEIVSAGKTGTLVPRGDVRAMRDAIAGMLLDDQKRGEMSVQSRLKSIAEYRLDIQASRYLSLYRSLK